MKTSSLLASILPLVMALRLAPGAYSQEVPQPIRAEPKVDGSPAPLSPGKVDETHIDTTGTLHLAPAALAVVVDSIQQFASELRDSNGASVPMPNVVFGPGTQEIPVAPVRLRNVTPVQALALVAAAAGCTLEPVTAPKELATGTGEPDKVIGYRFVVVPPTQSIFGSRLPRPTLSATSKSAPQYFVQDKPGAPPSLVRVPAQQSQQTSQSQQAQQAQAGITPAMPVMEVPAPQFTELSKPDELTVRVYALGMVLRGTREEMKEKEVGVLTLIEEALTRADLSERRPDVSFHSGTKTLLVKANNAQHEIISQIVRALQDNEASNAAAAASPQ